MARVVMKVLLPSIENDDVESSVVRAATAPETIQVEPVGKAFFALKYGITSDASDDGADDSVSKDVVESEYIQEWRRLYAEKEGNFQQDHYELLGLSAQRHAASADQIKAAYRAMSLIYHPDKRPDDPQAEALFKGIGKAYEVLSDPHKRTAYDSSEDFDDSVPTETEAKEGDFYEVFAPVFMRYAKWSRETPVPLCGDTNTPIEDVEEFYNFWTAFKSWRDFSHLDEYNLDEAQSRDEKRWMEQNNKRARDKLKKKETVKLSGLVDMAYKYDPRIKAKRAAEKAAKEEERAAKEAERKKREDEKRRIEEEERCERERIEQEKKEEELRIKKEREREKKALRKERSRLRKACENASYANTVDVELLCLELETLQLTNLCQIIEGGSGGDEAFQKAVEEARGVVEKRELVVKEKQAEAAKQAEEAAKRQQEQNSEWTMDELTLLSKAFTKFPGGIQDRWAQIAGFIGTKTEREVINKSKEMRNVDKTTVVQDVVRETEYDRLQKKKKQQHEITAAPDKNFDALNTPPKAPATDWSPDEQKKLEEALAKFPNSIESSERWKKISEHVGSRDVSACKKRYKALVTYYKALNQWKKENPGK